LFQHLERVGLNKPNPALITQRGARPMTRWALLLLCAAYILPGIFGRDPWRSADGTAFGGMVSLAEGRSPWWAPALGGVPIDGGLLPHWLGAASIMACSPWLDAALAARIPFALLLAGTLALTWYATYHLARTEAAQPLALAFGGEPEPRDYARAMADAGLLALMACLGLLQLGHETTPELAQLFGAALYLWALAAAPFRGWRANLGAVAGLCLLASSGAPTMAVLMGLAGAAVLWRSSYAVARAHLAWACLAVVVAAAVALAMDSWAHRGGFQWQWAQLWQLAKLGAWFLWPAWPLAVWTLWRWRHSLARRHVAVPMVNAGVALAACVWMGGSDRALMLGLPGLAVLAAFALPTLSRNTAAAIDWLAMCFFTGTALFLWVMYIAIQTGTPAQPAANVARLAEGFVARFSLMELCFALVASAAWIWLVRWRTGRSREAVWKGLVLSAGGVSLGWLLVMSLMLPLLDYARSQRPWVIRLDAHLQGAQCVSAVGVGSSSVAALEYLGKYTVDAVRAPSDTDCEVLVKVTRRAPANAELAGWRLVAQVRRPTDRNEVTLVYKRH
jgi:hypothetical protein